MKKPSKKKATGRNDRDVVFVPLDLPVELEAKLQVLAAKAGLTLNDYLSKLTSELHERLESLSLQPVKSLTLRPVTEPAPRDLLPVRVQFENSHEE